MLLGMELPTLECKRCGHKWHPRRDQLPAVCPNLKCKSSYWNRERRVPRKVVV